MPEMIPLISIQVEHIQYTMQQAFTKHLLDMDKMFAVAIQEACKPENVQAVLTAAAKRHLQAAVENEVDAFFRYGPGREEVSRLVSQALSYSKANVGQQPTNKHEGT